jgi:hypothetical protein
MVITILNQVSGPRSAIEDVFPQLLDWHGIVADGLCKKVIIILPSALAVRTFEEVLVGTKKLQYTIL